VACLCAAGCQIGRSAFRIDSDSRTPIFGFDLLSKERSDSKYQNIRQAGGNDATPELLQLNHERPAERSKWTKWLNPLSKPKRIPLPMLDVDEDFGDPAEVEPADALDYGF
jgi:hypothetical protein